MRGWPGLLLPAWAHVIREKLSSLTTALGEVTLLIFILVPHGGRGQDLPAPSGTYHSSRKSMTMCNWWHTQTHLLVVSEHADPESPDPPATHVEIQ